jgi:hypothetical protein
VKSIIKRINKWEIKKKNKINNERIATSK